MKKVVITTVLIVCSAAAFPDNSRAVVTRIHLCVESFICVVNPSGAVVFSTQSGNDANVVAGSETFVVKSNCSAGYSIANASDLTIVGPSGASYPTVTAAATTTGGSGPTTGDTLTVTFHESASWSTTAAANLSYSATVTLTNRS
jgi:hypothetical protein